eukprot:GHVH01012640.1.p1 GENE.GHVH01012640.1~~GHVH01012640.1.p1  ORF type:complete len:216 (+),score=24.48 GHVH01012640.1:502-1149(+)
MYLDLSRMEIVDPKLVGGCTSAVRQDASIMTQLPSSSASLKGGVYVLVDGPDSCEEVGSLDVSPGSGSSLTHLPAQITPSTDDHDFVADVQDPLDHVREILSPRVGTPLFPNPLVLDKEDERNTVSGVSLEKKEEILREKLQHLSPPLRTKYYDLFDQYGEVWREPRSAQMLTDASFQVLGDPVVCKQRALSDDMMLEFNKQVDDMLAKGVIRPS